MHPIFAAFTAGLGLALLYGTLLAAQVPDIFATAKADVWLSANNGDDANDGLAPEKAVKTIGRAYAAAKAAAAGRPQASATKTSFAPSRKERR